MILRKTRLDQQQRLNFRGTFESLKAPQKTSTGTSLSIDHKHNSSSIMSHTHTHILDSGSWLAFPPVATATSSTVSHFQHMLLLLL